MNSDDVYDFLSARSFLESRLSALHDRRPNYSLNALCRDASFAPGHLSKYRSGKRNLGEDVGKRLGTCIGLDGEELDFFLELIRLERAVSPAERERALEHIVTHVGFRSARPLSQETLRFMSTWLYAAIHELSKEPEFQCTVAWIQPRLELKATDQEIVDAVDGLKTLDMLGVADSTNKLVTGHDAAGVASYAWHRTVINASLQALNETHPSKRDFMALTLSVSPQDMEVVRQEVRGFVQKMLHRFTPPESGPRVVVQINAQCFPLAISPPKTGEEDN